MLATITTTTREDAHNGEHHETSHDADHETDEHGYPTRHAPDVHIDGDDFANPLVHVLMLTAIVVGVSTLGVGLAITKSCTGSLEPSKRTKSTK